MARLGISLYPDNSNVNDDVAYIRKAGKAGFRRVFLSLLSVEGKTRESIIEEYREINKAAHEEGMEVILDIAPFIFKELGLEYTDLSFFHEMNVDGIRLDEGFGGGLESQLSFNPYGLKIELNSSLGNDYVENVMSHYPNPNTIITCHNFYPQRYTGLSQSHFDFCNDKVKKLGLPIAAFVSSQNADTFGPWPVNEGLCTLEAHRDLPIDVQIRHLVATQMIDDIIIANTYASDDELEICSKINPGLLSFKIDFEKELQESERKIIYEHEHHVRGDMSEYMVRSTMPRITYANESVRPENTRDLKRGDVIILNDEYPRYKGELQIVTKDMPNDGRRNVVGHIPENEMMLLDFAKPWRPFAFLK
ncbi:MAG: MupG family TIM beta-alpha barrel fold protein [Erysipelothrix sp.]